MKKLRALSAVFYCNNRAFMVVMSIAAVKIFKEREDFGNLKNFV